MSGRAREPIERPVIPQNPPQNQTGFVRLRPQQTPISLLVRLNAVKRVRTAIKTRGCTTFEDIQL